MTPEKQTLLLIKGSIAEMPAEDQEAIKNALHDIRCTLGKYSAGHGACAIALLGAELAAQEDYRPS